MFQDAGGNAYEMEAFIAFTTETNFADVLKFFPTAEGFYDFENNEYIYQYKDHLGNVRLSFKREGNQPIVTDSNDYYPFGMSFVRNSEEDAHFGTGSYFNYKYNGKELQETGMYDYGARFYMPDIGRWGVVDNYSELGHDRTHYGYVSNNPIKFIDPDGNWEHNFEMDENGRVTKMENTNDNFDRLYKKGSFNEEGMLKSGLQEYRDYVQVNKTAPNDGSVISDLQETNKNGDSYGTTTNSADARRVFQFAADNSNVEWTIGGFKTGEGNKYLVGTSHIMNEVTAPWKFGEKGLTYGNLFYAGHTHPFTREAQPHDNDISKPGIYNFIYYTGAGYGRKNRESYFVPYFLWEENGVRKTSIKENQRRQVKLPDLIPY